jgi:hypothetical protein
MATCPVCNHEAPPYLTGQISMAGWIVFAALLFVCLP